MDNHIVRVNVWPTRLSPAEAELRVVVRPQQLTSTTQVHGRLMGPRCRYTSTVEVAYALRESSREYEKEGEPCIGLRVIIPEPNFWEPQSPHLYEGSVELWQGRQLTDQRRIRHGLRVLSLSPGGLLCNGRPLVLRGADVGASTCAREEF